MNLGIKLEEILYMIEVGAVWGPLDLGFAADDMALKLAILHFSLAFLTNKSAYFQPNLVFHM